MICIALVKIFANMVDVEDRAFNQQQGLSGSPSMRTLPLASIALFFLFEITSLSALVPARLAVFHLHLWWSFKLFSDLNKVPETVRSLQQFLQRISPWIQAGLSLSKTSCAVGPCSADSQVTLLTMSMYGSPTQMKTLEDICEDLVVQHHSSPLLMVHH